MTNENPTCPEPPDAAEVIVRQRFFIEMPEHGKPYAVPELLLLGNREGFEWLSEYFAFRAANVPTTFQIEGGDPDDHEHLDGSFFPVSAHLCDEIEFRVGVLTDANRAAALAKYAVDVTPAERGCLRTRFKAWIRRAKQGLRGTCPPEIGMLATTSRGFTAEPESESEPE